MKIINIKMKIALAILFSVFDFYLSQKSVNAGSYTVQQLTNTFRHSRSISDVDGGRIVWSEIISFPNGQDRNNIFFYDGNNTLQLTNDDIYDHSGARIDGDYIVWMRGDGEIFLYKISTGEISQITNSPETKDISPKISKGKIVWITEFGYPNGDGCCTSDIALYDISTLQIQKVTDDTYPTFVADTQADTDGDMVVWVRGNDGGQYEIYKKNLVTGEVMRLTNNYYPDNSPSIDGGRIAWQGYDGDDWEIFLYDGSTVSRVTSNITNDSNPILVNNKLVWQAQGDIFGNFPEIGIYDLQTDSKEIIGPKAISPNTDGVRVVWIELVYGGYIGGRDIWYRNVFVKDTITGDVTQLTENDDNVLDYYFPVHISQYLIAWVAEPLVPYLGPNIYVAFRGNTPAGNNVSYSEDGVTLIYSQVDVAGNTTISISSSGTRPPTGFKLGNPPTYYNILTTAVFSGTVELCINYVETSIIGSESQFKLMHFVDGQGWIDSTTSLDTDNNVICGTVTSFSEFTIMAQPAIQDLINRVEEMNLQQGIENSLDAKLQRAQDAQNAESNNSVTEAINALEAFINEVEAQRDIKLINGQADELQSFSNNLIKIVQGIRQF